MKSKTVKTLVATVYMNICCIASAISMWRGFSTLNDYSDIALPAVWFIAAGVTGLLAFTIYRDYR